MDRIGLRHLKGQLGLEHHGGRTTLGVTTRIAQRLLALAAAIWHNWATHTSDKRSLIGEPPTFRAPDPIGSGPEWRTISARASPQVQS
jgi:hypothetical protein